MLAIAVRPLLDQVSLWLHQYGYRHIAAGAIAAVLTLLLLWRIFRRPSLSAEQIERQRRDRLAAFGRITDGSLIDVRTLTNEESSSPTPEVLVYRYRLAGVVYECAQDVSRLADFIRDCQVGNAVQVRYDPRNPGDSILLAESWSGLWLPTGLAGEPLPNAARPPSASQR